MDMPVGDINSQERGSGARANTDKPNWALFPLIQLSYLLREELIQEGPNPEDPITLDDVIYALSQFQRFGYPDLAYECQKMAVVCYMDQQNCDVWDALEEVIRVWEYGEGKYAAFNWMKGMPWSVPLACAMRHIRDLEKGKTHDDESGRHHLAHVICNLQMLCHYVHYYTEGNDLPTRWFEVSNDGRQNATQ